MFYLRAVTSAEVSLSKTRSNPQHSGSITSPALWTSLVYRSCFTGMMSCSPHLDGFHFIPVMTFPHHSEKSKPFGEAYYLPPLAMLHPIRQLLGTAVGGLFPKCLFLDSSLHSSSFDWSRTLLFLSLKKYPPFMFYLWLTIYFFCLPFLLFVQIVCLLWWVSQINEKTEVDAG